MKRIFFLMGVFLLLCTAAQAEYAWTDNGSGITLTGWSGEETVLVLPSELDGKPVTEIAPLAFSGIQVDKVTVPGSVIKIGDNAFRNAGMKYLRLETGITELGRFAFSGCRALESAVIPGTVSAIGDRAFENCTSLGYVTLPASVTHLGSNPFKGCSQLTMIALPKDHPNLYFYENALYSLSDQRLISCLASGMEAFSVLAGTQVIGAYAFYGSDTLTSVTLPAGLLSIEARAFAGCTHLAELIRPASIPFVDESAFAGCISLALPNP